MTEKEKWDNLIKELEKLRDDGGTIINISVESEIRETETITGEFIWDVVGKIINLQIANGRNKK